MEIRSAASDLGLYCLPVTHLGVSSLNGLILSAEFRTQFCVRIYFRTLFKVLQVYELFSNFFTSTYKVR